MTIGDPLQQMHPLESTAQLHSSRSSRAPPNRHGSEPSGVPGATTAAAAAAAAAAEAAAQGCAGKQAKAGIPRTPPAWQPKMKPPPPPPPTQGSNVGLLALRTQLHRPAHRQHQPGGLPGPAVGLAGRGAVPSGQLLSSRCTSPGTQPADVQAAQLLLTVSVTVRAASGASSRAGAAPSDERTGRRCRSSSSSSSSS